MVNYQYFLLRVLSKKLVLCEQVDKVAVQKKYNDVTVFLQRSKIMRGHHHKRPVPCSLVEKLKQRIGARRIESYCWLVENVHVRRMRDCSGNLNTLLLAA